MNCLGILLQYSAIMVVSSTIKSTPAFELYIIWCCICEEDPRIGRWLLLVLSSDCLCKTGKRHLKDHSDLQDSLNHT